MIELNDKQTEKLYNEIRDRIIAQLGKERPGDLSDIANAIGIAVGMAISDSGHGNEIWAFQKGDFVAGYDHGYSLTDGTHG